MDSGRTNCAYSIYGWHVVASHLLNKGVPDQMRAEVLGHSPGRHLATTARYSHATVEYLRKVYEELLDDLAPELW